MMFTMRLRANRIIFEALSHLEGSLASLFPFLPKAQNSRLSKLEEGIGGGEINTNAVCRKHS